MMLYFELNRSESDADQVLRTKDHRCIIWLTAGDWSQIEEGVPEKKRLIYSYRKKKNLDAKRHPVTKSKLGQPDLREADVDGIATSSAS
ncbi:hypothetical protein Syun_021031 [Stephania yunnanensis]|uniref:Uncharacterized protein n=1 Tax=Stephania yunnanensis TaxID=152371 RepID=A0AAP0NQB3_9MAGN